MSLVNSHTCILWACRFYRLHTRSGCKCKSVWASHRGLWHGHLSPASIRPYSILRTCRFYSPLFYPVRRSATDSFITIISRFFNSVIYSVRQKSDPPKIFRYFLSNCWEFSYEILCIYLSFIPTYNCQVTIYNLQIRQSYWLLAVNE